MQGAQCNTWVWHPTTHACWLKHQRPAELQATAARLTTIKPGPLSTPWQSGIWLGHKQCEDCEPPVTYNGCIAKDKCNTTRECGSPAIDGYSHVDPKCFESSRTAKLYHALLAQGTELAPFSEPQADYDGLGVRWGIGHKKERWADCEKACLDFRPSRRGGGGPFTGLPCNVWTWCSRVQRTSAPPFWHSNAWLLTASRRSLTSPAVPCALARDT